jgi:hypothetical protein
MVAQIVRIQYVAVGHCLDDEWVEFLIVDCLLISIVL